VCRDIEAITLLPLLPQPIIPILIAELIFEPKAIEGCTIVKVDTAAVDLRKFLLCMGISFFKGNKVKQPISFCYNEGKINNIFVDMTGLLKWLQRPFPIGNRLGQNSLISILFGIFIFSFLVIFRPFPSQDSESHLWLTSAGYGLITAIVMIMNFALLAILFKTQFESDKYTIGSALLTSVWNISIIAIANWLFYRYATFHAEETRSLLYFLGVTLSVGIFPVIILLFWFERIYFIRYSTRAESISGKMTEGPHTINNVEIQLYGEGKTDTILLQSSGLICIKSEGNYVAVFHRSGESTKREVLRGSLKAFEEQLSDQAQFVRCHQSYIINKQLLENISGNARGYLLDLKNLDTQVPVSRQFEVSQLSPF